MVVSASGLGYPSAVVDVVMMTFYCTVVLETSGPLDDVFSNEWIVESGLESGTEHVLKSSGFGFCGLY